MEEKEGLTFWGHLEVLRGHLIRSAIAIVVLAIAAFIAKDIIFHQIILAPKEPFFFTNKAFCHIAERFSLPALCINAFPLKIINIEMAGQFTIHIMVSLIAGLILSVPYIFYEFWKFIKPALLKKEQQSARYAVWKASALFFAGVLFSYFLIVPLAINFLGSYQVSHLVENHISLRSYISTVTMLTFATGLVFELPVIIYFLSRVGIITPHAMRKNRKIAIVIIIAFSAVITPPDVFSQILVSIPVIILYEFSIGIAARQFKRRSKDLVA